jgi:uncharacterized protein YcbK (DUF882 family)
MITRRQVLQFGGCAAAGVGASALMGAPGLMGAYAAAPRPQGLLIRHLATGESLAVETGAGRDPSAASMSRIEAILRDPATDERGRMDPQLIRQLLDLAAEWTPLPVYEVLDAYRSDSRTAGAGLHGEGRAIDLRLSGVACADFAARAAAHARGGVGYYRSADFVHLDTGAARCWQG